MHTKNIFRGLVDEKLVRVLSVLINNSSRDFNLLELSKEANVPTATTGRILEKLHKLEIVEIIQVNKFKVYKLSKAEHTKALSSMFDEKINPLQIFIDEIKIMNEIDQIILHGEQKEKETNLLLIGNKIDSTKVDSIVERIKTQHSYEISFVSLDEAQYQKLTRMGLYSGKKNILFSK